MPTKKTSRASASSDAPETKPKRKVVRKKKMDVAPASVEAAASSAPQDEPIHYDIPAQPESAPASAGSGAAAKSEAEESHRSSEGQHPDMPQPAEIKTPEMPTAPAVMPSAMPESRLQTKMNDIKPKQTNADASFLAPEQFSFGLKQQREDSKEKRANTVRWIKPFIYVVSIIVIVLAASMIALSYYAQRGNDGTQGTQGTRQKQGGGNQSAYSMALVNVPVENYDAFVQDISAADKAVKVDATPTTLSVPDSSTLYYKSAAKGEASKLADYLNTKGIAAKLVQNDTLHVDLVLYVSKTDAQKTALASASANGSAAADANGNSGTPGQQNLHPQGSAPTSLQAYNVTVYNASGISGLAKKYCAALAGLKPRSCKAANAAGAQQGISVFMKDMKVKDALTSVSKLTGATYAPAEKNQVEDVKIVVGTQQ